ncbi:DUF559 domain-containing protein [Gordonia sp. zg691]|uniref:DUF559 domain-containing protein n=1 Tax=Gordonia jinghuaiqii TaxID=2758710 RepID=A0A7D7QNN5_9ACTN|nr:type IV toxin-antitoxin system AbiEi family antitoxin domain-containing protein [Gordonia jinghuaiqii]MBD0861082.1 DUF559 domain-containing protein [Gordonia jinghuaiqii]MCR5979758.1 DUF559 domain-containing protein [Gordonia jinghuaiqii]QMT00846.1 DUF559 domain-containing protein [Gordonia jinghuaiqii]
MDDLHQLISRQDGVLSASQAMAAGMTRSSIGRRLRAGDWVAVARAVYLVAGHRRSARAQARIAVLSVGPDAVLGGVAAAWWLGLRAKEPAKHLVLTPFRGRHARSSATAVVRHRDLSDADVMIRDDLRVTTAALSVLDASVELGVGILDSALLSGGVTLDDLKAAHARYPKRHGSPTISRFLHLLDDGARSEAERVVVGLFDAAGLDGWTSNLPQHGYIIDFAFSHAKLAVEVDGFAFHRDTETFQRDRTKRNALIGDGWTVLNFTWADLIERPEHVVTAVRQALGRFAA